MAVKAVVNKKSLSPSAPRMRKFRERHKRIELCRNSDWIVWMLQSYFHEYNIPITDWVRANDFYKNPIGSSDMKIMLSLPNWDFFVEKLNNSEIEKSTLKIGSTNIILIRPRWEGIENVANTNSSTNT